MRATANLRNDNRRNSIQKENPAKPEAPCRGIRAGRWRRRSSLPASADSCSRIGRSPKNYCHPGLLLRLNDGVERLPTLVHEQEHGILAGMRELVLILAHVVNGVVVYFHDDIATL